jgi:hypothetical protein
MEALMLTTGEISDDDIYRQQERYRIKFPRVPIIGYSLKVDWNNYEEYGRKRVHMFMHIVDSDHKFKDILWHTFEE